MQYSFPMFIAAAALAAPAPAQDMPAATVRIELSSFSYSPGTLTLAHGQAYEIVFVNKSGSGHDFTAPAFFGSAMIAPADAGKVTGGRVRLHGREEVKVTLLPLRAGVYEFHCSHPLHASIGMRGSISVS
jgi:plastocyanin